jgi:hypothetical protein
VSWSAALQTIERELGADVARLVDTIARERFGGERLYVPTSCRASPDDTAAAVLEAPSVAAAARQLGCHRVTVYRRLREWRRIR